MKQTPAERNHDLVVANTKYVLRARTSEELLRKLYETHTMNTRPSKKLLDEIDEHLREPWK